MGSAGTITSCKDYDDEIDEINQKLNTLSSKDELTAQISQLTSTISAAQSAAAQASTEAANALTAAKEAAAQAEQASTGAGQAAGQAAEALTTAKSAATTADKAATDATAAAATAADAAKKAAKAAEDAAKAVTAGADATKALAEAKAAAEAAKEASAAAKAGVDEAKKAAADAAAAATAAAADAAAKAVADAQAEIAKAAATAAEAAAKEAALDVIESKIASLEAEIAAKADADISEELMAQWQADFEKLSAEALAVLGHRLTDLAVIPTTHVNGIAAITLTTLTYIPQEYISRGDHAEDWEDLQIGEFHDNERPVLDHIALGYDAQNEEDIVAPVFISSEKNEAYYHVAPSNGVRTEDIKLPIFDNIVSTNITRADPVVTENNPLEPTAYEINNNVLKVTFKKTTTEPIGSFGNPHWYYPNFNPTILEDETLRENQEKFFMVSLKAPIAEENLMEDETEAYVNSEYVRVEELIKVPYIAHNRANFNEPIRENMFADEIQNTTDDEIGSDGLFVHYHDSVCIYNSIVNQYVDILAEYNKELDLTKWVTVCLTDNFWRDHSNHEKLENYADYGLGFRFYVAEAPYITLGGPDQNTLETDQQQFAEIKDAKKGIMTSKVYTINGDPNQTSVGREPIVRAELWDEANGNLIAIRYIKVKWVKSIGKISIDYKFKDALFACGSFNSLIGTQEMNEAIYSQIGENGVTKQVFHITWPDPAEDEYHNLVFTEGSEDWGVVLLLKNDEGSVESYNIWWTISHYDVVRKLVKDFEGSWEVWQASGKPLEFTKTFYWKSPTASTLEINLKRDLYPEEFKLWGYDGRYWRTNSNWEVFNVNPVVYDTKEPNPAWATEASTSLFNNNLTNNIYTDLLNGFLDDLGKKPITGADGAIFYTTTRDMQMSDYNYEYKAGKKYYYSKQYGYKDGYNGTVDEWTWNITTSTQGANGVSRDDGIYNWFYKKGVRFTYDVDKLNTGKYEYSYYDAASKSYKKGYAKVADNDGKEPKLYIVPDENTAVSDDYLAATIVNYEPNKYKNSEIPQPELTYNIMLQEKSPASAPYTLPAEDNDPTEAAKALVGQYVPIKLVADLCDDTNPDATANDPNYNAHPAGGKLAHVVTIKAYDAFIIEPLKPKNVTADDFTDATVSGSTISVAGVTLYQSWNADAKGYYYPVMNGKISNYQENFTVNANGVITGGSNDSDVIARRTATQYIYDMYLELGYSSADALAIANLAYQLGRFYETVAVKFDTENIKTNLALDAEGNLVPTEGVTDGPLPSNTEVVYDGSDETLTYHNYSGTPVNWSYKMYIPVTYGYKWKTMVGTLEVNVISNQGTDDNQ